MSFHIVVPASVNGGFYKRVGKWSFGIMAHSLQCDQVWIFLINRSGRRFAYRTKGDATKNLLTFGDAGFYWPWQKRFCSGRG